MGFFVAASVGLAVVVLVLVLVYRRRSVEDPRTLAHDERRAADNCRPLAHVTVLPRDPGQTPEDGER